MLSLVRCTGRYSQRVGVSAAAVSLVVHVYSTTAHSYMYTCILQGLRGWLDDAAYLPVASFL